MRLLLDTHVAIWALAFPELLTSPARDLIAEAGNTVHVSAVSVWEIAIKHSQRRRNVPPFSGTDALRYFRQAGYALLAVTPEHAARVERLPWFHSDPFDRLLVAQALSEPLLLITHDPKVAAYSKTIIHF